MCVQELERAKKYRIEVVIGYNGTKKIRHVETFYGGKKEALIRESEIKKQVSNNTFVKNTSIKMNDLVQEWLTSKKDVLGVKTYEEYKRTCKNITDILGHLKIKDITPKILEDFYSKLRNYKGKGKTREGYSEKTVKNHYTLITELFNTAINWGYLNSNPNRRVKQIKVHKKEIQCYSPEEVEKLVKALQDEPIKYQAVILLTLDSGCREGEITGLTWEDVDFKKGTITINKTTQYVAGVGTFEKTPKSDTSNRSIYISQSTLEVLKRYKAYQDERRFLLGDKWQNSKRVFTTDFGEDMCPGRPYKIFKAIIKKHGLKDISFHGLRHTSISLQISKGIQVQVISKRAGHSSVGITHQIYSHFFDEEFKEVASVMDSILSVG